MKLKLLIDGASRTASTGRQSVAASRLTGQLAYTLGKYWPPVHHFFWQPVVIALQSKMGDPEFEEAFDEAIDEITICLSGELQEILNKKRIWMKSWVGRRDVFGASATLLREMAMEDPDGYKTHMRMSVEQFNELLGLVEPLIYKKDTIMRNAIPVKQKLEVTLRYLASGDSFQSLSLLFRIPATSISSFLPEVLQAVYTVLQKKYLNVPQTTAEWEDIQKSFVLKWNFPSCCGAIDGKHVSIKRPAGSCAEFYNYKGGYSVILLALVDAECRFIYIDVGTNGRANDGGVFKLSTLKEAMDKNQLNLPKDYVIVGDDAFPLTPSLMKPYSKRQLSLTERIFNYRLSRARRVVENAFGILAARFRVFGKNIEVELSTVDLIVKCCCVLHNWLRTTSPSAYFGREWTDSEDLDSGVIQPGKWRLTGTQLPSITSGRTTNTYSKRAHNKRETFATHFSGEGSVPWQLNAIGMQ